MIVAYFERKKHEEEDMVDLGFDEDGEEDDMNPTYDELGEIKNVRDADDTDDTDIIDSEEE